MHLCTDRTLRCASKRSGRRNRVTVSGAMKAWRILPVSLASVQSDRIAHFGSPFRAPHSYEANWRQTPGERHADYSTNALRSPGMVQDGDARRATGTRTAFDRRAETMTIDLIYRGFHIGSEDDVACSPLLAPFGPSPVRRRLSFSLHISYVLERISAERIICDISSSSSALHRGNLAAFHSG